MKKIAIIGAGYTGMACAKKLIEKDYKVSIFEESNEVGGMAKCIEENGYIIEKHYRHIYRSDKYIIELIKELELEAELKWLDTQMAYYSKEGLYKFGTPISLLTYKPLNFIQKIKFGLCIIHLKLIRNYKKLEKYTVKEWICKKYGKDIYDKIWEPLLFGKFGNEKENISMSWLWGKINLRSTNTTINGEILGYMQGSWKKLADKMKSYLLENKCNINLEEKVLKVYKNNDKFIIETNLNKYEDYDEVISTLPYNASKDIFDTILTDKEKENLKNMKYMSAKTLMINSKKSLSKYYWINIGDNTIPFVGIIEHTNMVSKDNYNDNNIIYISNYLESENSIYKMNDKELLELYLPYLKRINPNISEEDIISTKVFEEECAQPVIKTDYTQNKLPNMLESGAYIANMAQIYPEDRGMNYAVRLGYDVAKQIEAKFLLHNQDTATL